MITKASGRSALLLAAGLWICGLYLAGSSQAVAGSDDAATPASAPSAPIALSKYTKHSSHHVKKSAHPSPAMWRRNPPTTRTQKAAGTDVAARRQRPAVHARLLCHSAIGRQRQCTATRRRHARRQECPRHVGASQQHRPGRERHRRGGRPTFRSFQPISSTMSIAHCRKQRTAPRHRWQWPPPTRLPSANAPVMAASSPLMATGSGNSTWDHTSLIGKIFIGFGVLLTMASAARMFIA